MPRPSAPAVAAPPPSALVASAADVSEGGFRPRSTKAVQWQVEAWNFYDVVGELRYAVNWTGQAMSRVRLTVKRVTPDGAEDVDDGPAVDALEALFGGETGQSQMLSTVGIHMQVPGESYLIGEPQDGADDEWMVLSTEECTFAQGKWRVDRGDGKKRPLADNAMVIRLWRSHPRRYLEADSPVRAVLPVLRELDALTKHISANVDSRLAGAGILLLPNEISFASPTSGASPTDMTADPFLAALTEAMIDSIEDRSNPASLVPIVVKAPAEVIPAVQHLTFASPLDAQAQSLREEAIRRLALGMDLPPEVMLGQGDSNHWSAWQVEESTLKVHIEPLCELVCAGLTRHWLHPVLEALGQDDPDLFIEADTSDLRLRPDHSQSAQELNARGLITDEAARRENGFDESDAPKPQEVRDILLRQIAFGSSDLVAAAAAKLGLDLPAPAAAAAPGPPDVQVTLPIGRAPGDPETTRALPPAQDEAPDVTEDPALAAALIAACESTVLRAIERANNRLHKRGPTGRVSTAQAAEALAGEWGYVPRLAALIQADEGRLRHALNDYAVYRVSSGTEHDPRTLLAALTSGKVRG